MLYQNPNTLWVRICQAQYLKERTFHSSACSPQASGFGKRIWATQDLVTMGLCYRVKKDNATKIWEDPWLSGHKEGIPCSSSPKTLAA